MGTACTSARLLDAAQQWHHLDSIMRGPLFSFAYSPLQLEDWEGFDIFRVALHAYLALTPCPLLSS